MANNGKTKSDKDKKLIAKAYKIAGELQGGVGGRAISNKDFQRILARLKKSGKTFSDLDAWISKKRPQKVSKPKSPHLKHGGKTKKKMRTYKKGGKV